MPDPIEELSRLRSGIDMRPMPPAADVRRRGDRLRVRARVAMTTAAVAVAAAVVAPVLVLAPSDDRGAPAPAAPSVTSDPPTDRTGAGTALSPANLLTDADTVYDADADWGRPTTDVGDERPAPPLCDQISLQEMGAGSTFHRSWQLLDARTGQSDGVQVLDQRIGEFPDPGAAEDSGDDLLVYLEACGPPDASTYEFAYTLVTPTPPGVTFAATATATWTLVGQPGGESITAGRTDVSIVVAGDRLSLVQHVLPDADHDWPDGAPVERMTPAAAERLLGAPAVDPAPPTGGAAASSVVEGDLLTDADTVYSDGADWFTVDTFAGDGQAPFHPCARAGLTELDARSVVHRRFEMRATVEVDTPEEIEGDGLHQAVAQFDDPAAARAAYDEVAGWIRDCEGRIPGADRFTVSSPGRPVTVPGGEAVVIDVHWGPVPAEIDPYGDMGYINEVGLAVAGDRLTVLSSVVIGQDYNFMGPTPVERMLPVGVRRMQR